MKILHHNHHLLPLPLLLLLLPLMLDNGSSKIISCNQTPYPEICFHYFINKDYELTNSKEINSDQIFTQFLDFAIHVTLTQAILAHDHLVSSMELTLFDEIDDDKAKSAWVDCLELYEDSVDQLNKSISASIFNPSDHLTRLSASISNHQTCQNGFHDFGFSSRHFNEFPFQILTNFSKLISNSLAITKASIVNPSSKISGNRRLLSITDSHPEWVSDDDRKLLQGMAGSGARKVDMVVAQDGTGHYKTICEGVEALKKVRKGRKRYVIYVKRGVYRENVVIEKKMKNLMIIGDGIDSTIISARKNVQDGSTTFRSATFVSGDGFIARDITFENTAGPRKHQAVALRSSSDHSIFYRCSFKGYQDTLYAHSNRQFFRECDIYGTVDFIFGDATAVFQNCNIFVRKPMKTQKNTVTAQARSDPNENTGFVIQHSVIGPAPDLKPVERMYGTYLGRPWKEYSRTVIMKSFIDGFVSPAGWLPWDGKFGLKTLYYGEFMNSGNGARTSGRVRWLGFHVMKSVEAERFTVGSFLEGESWMPVTGVPFVDGL